MDKRQTTKENKAFCIMPWVHLHVNTRGMATACCLSNLPYGHIDREDIGTIWNGAAIQKFRIKMLNGEKEKRCNTCYEREESGLESMRIENNNKYVSLLAAIQNPKISDDTLYTLPKYIDIRFSNICNFRCRTCWHGSSSKWYEEGKLLKNTAGKTAIIEASTDPLSFYNQIETIAKNLDEIYFAGGEPLIMQEHFLLLNYLDKQRLHHIKLRYNTNFSTLSYKGTDLLELWANFKNVTLQVSLDGAGKRGEYIRKDQKWDKVITHLNQLKSLCPHIRLVLNPTVSIYNALHLPDFHQSWVEKSHIDIYDIELNLLHRPIYLNIKTLPTILKKKVKIRFERHIEWLNDNYSSSSLANHHEKVVSQFQNMLTYLYSADCSQYFPKFIQYNSQLDQMRDETFAQVFPELMAYATHK